MADILKEDEEHENVYRHLRVVIGETKDVFVELLTFYLGTIAKTYEEFIERNAHEIHHFCYPEQCCQCQCQLCNNKRPQCTCRPIRTTRKPILHPPQLACFLDKYGTKIAGHDPTYRSAPKCCCPVNGVLNIKDLDVTLARFLLVNFTTIVQSGTQERKALDDVVDMRNSFAHAAKTRMSNQEYQTCQQITTKQLLILAKVYGKEQETKDKLEAINNEPFNLKVCIQLFNALLLQARSDQNLQEKDIQDRTIVEGDDVCFEIWFKEKNIPVKWYKNDTESLIDSDKMSIITRGNIHKLCITRCCEDDKGVYMVQVRDTYRQAILDVKDFCSRNLKDINCIEGNNVTFDCEVLHPDMKAQWYKDGAIYQGQGKGSTTTELKRHILNIPCVEMNDSGRYEIDIQSRRRSAELTIEYFYTRNLQNVTCTEGEDVLIDCEVVYSDMEAHWYKDDVRVQNNSKRYITTEEKRHVLRIPYVEVQDSGRYKIDIQNRQRSAYLRVEPYFTKHLEKMRGIVGEPVTFVCEVVDSNTTIKWFLNDNEIESSRRIKLKTSGRQHTLRINYTTVSDSGTYTVIVNNRKRKTTLLVEDNKLKMHTYLNAIQTKTERRFHIRVMIVGKNRVGKSCLLRRLLNEDIEGVESTDGIDISIHRCKIRLSDGKWIFNAEKDPKRDYAMRIKRARREEHVVYDDVKAISTNQTNIPEQIEHKKGDVRTKIQQTELSLSMKETNIPSAPSPSSETLESELIPEYAHDQKFQRSYTKGQRTPIQPTGFTRKVSTVLTGQVATEIDDFLFHIEKYEDENKVYVEIRFWDFAGEKDYYGTHHIFLDPNALYLLVSNCSEDIKQSQPCETYDSIGEYIDFWFDTIHNCADVKEETADQQIDPPIIAICTGQDKLTGKVGKKKDQYRQGLSDIIQDEKKRKHLRDICFVSNTKPLDADFNHLRDLIFEHGKRLQSFGEVLPLKWIRLEQSLDILRESGINIVSRNDIIDLSVKCGFDPEEREKEVESFLNHQHKIGSIMYYSDIEDFVILSQQWLADAFKCLVSDKIDNNIKLSDEWRRLEKTGILEKSLISKLFQKNPELKNETIQENMITVLNKFGIIGINCDEGHYYMPYMITSAYSPSLSEITKTFGALHEEQKSPWLCLEFDFFPLAYFTHVILHFISNYKMCFDKSLKKLSIYQAVGVFFVDTKNKFIVLFCKNTIAMQVWHWDHVPEQKYIEILKEMKRVIHQLKNKYKLRNLEYSVKLKCSDGDINSQIGRISHKDLLDQSKDEKYFCDEHNKEHDSNKLLNTWFYQYPDPGQRMPLTASTYKMSMSQNLERGRYTFPLTTHPKTPLIYQSQDPQRPLSPPGVSVPPKREKKLLEIVDPNTGKNILSDYNTQRSNPLGSTGSGGSRGQTPNITMDNSLPPQQDNAIAAQFAAQVAAAMRKPSPGMYTPNMIPSYVPSSVLTQTHVQPVLSTQIDEVQRVVPVDDVNSQNISDVPLSQHNTQSLSTNESIEVHSQNSIEIIVSDYNAQRSTPPESTGSVGSRGQTEMIDSSLPAQQDTAIAAQFAAQVAAAMRNPSLGMYTPNMIPSYVPSSILTQTRVQPVLSTQVDEVQHVVPVDDVNSQNISDVPLSKDNARSLSTNESIEVHSQNSVEIIVSDYNTQRSTPPESTGSVESRGQTKMNDSSLPPQQDNAIAAQFAAQVAAAMRKPSSGMYTPNMIPSYEPSSVLTQTHVQPVLSTQVDEVQHVVPVDDVNSQNISDVPLSKDNTRSLSTNESIEVHSQNSIEIIVSDYNAQRSTPPESTGSVGSRGQTEMMDSSLPPQQDNAIAAQFASQVTAAMRNNSPGMHSSSYILSDYYTQRSTLPGSTESDESRVQTPIETMDSIQIGQRKPSSAPTYNVSMPQNVGGYALQQTTNPFTPIMYQSPGQQRPLSIPGLSQSQPISQKREKKVLDIVNPNTGKYILSSDYYTQRSTPPGSTGSSGSRGRTSDVTMDNICNQLDMSEDEDQMGPAKASYPAQQGASLTAKNNQGKTPLEVCGDTRMEELVKQFTTAQASKTDWPSPVRIESLAQDCMVCSKHTACIEFMPCGHIITCYECCQKIKRCLHCNAFIESKTCQDGSEVSLNGEQPAAGVMESNLLQKKLQEMHGNFLCSICMERKRNMAFLCGHTVCNICGDSLQCCHMCGKPITKKMNLYA